MWQETFAPAITHALGDPFSVDDHGENGEITDADGGFVGLAGYDPLQDAAEAADRLMRAELLAACARDGDHLVTRVAFAVAPPRDFALWGRRGPLTALTSA